MIASRSTLSVKDLLVVDAVRSWRSARNAGRPRQPALYARLKLARAGLLAPVFDGLLGLLEAELRRPLRAGAPRDSGLVGDERRLLDLLAASAPAQPFSPLEAALCSTRILLREWEFAKWTAPASHAGRCLAEAKDPAELTTGYMVFRKLS
jgi:hypothetical protein